MQHYLAIDVGGTSLKYGIVQTDGTLLSNDHVPTPATWTTFLEQIDTIVNSAQKAGAITGIAFSAPGAVDSASGLIHGITALPYIHEQPFLKAFEDRYDLPVTVLNDANAAALAEGWTGAATSLKRYATVVIGTGVGGAFIDSNEVMVGSHFHGGEYGYWILDPNLPHPDGTWSKVGATAVLVKRCSDQLGRSLTGQDVFELQADPRIHKELEHFYRWNAIGLYNLQFGLDPERILIGGGISRRPEVRDGIKRHLDALTDSFGTFRIDVETCAHYNEANLIGAVRFHILQN